MATLSGSTIASTYTMLLKTTAVVDGTLRKVEDGAGTDTALKVSTAGIAIDTGDELYFDGGGNTYIHEVSADKLDIVVGGQTILEIGEAGGGASDYVAIQALNKLYFDGGSNTYIQQSAADVLDFYCGTVQMLTLEEASQDEVVVNEGGVDIDFRVETASSRTHSLFVEGSTGNVGIGNTDPSNKLEVSATAGDAAIEISTFSGTATHASILKLRKSSHATINTGQATVAGEDLGLIRVYGYDDDDDARIACEILFEGDAVPDGDAVPGRIKFRTAKDTDSSSPSTAMTITDGQDVGIGITTPDSGLHVKVSNTQAAYAVCHLESIEGTAGDSDILLWLDYSIDNDLSGGTRYISFHDAGGEIGWCAAASSSAMATAIQTSDVRFKEDIKDTAFEGLNTLNAIKMRDFTWNDKSRQNLKGKKEICRWVADEVYEVYPDAVMGIPGQMKDTLDEDGNKIGEEINQLGIADNIFIPMMMKSIQELSAKVTALENA